MANHLNTILSEMAESKRNAELLYEERRRRFLEDHPEANKADREMVRARLLAARGRISHEEADARESEAKAAFSRALKAAGLSADTFTYVPSCTLCDDTGLTVIGGYPCACALRRLSAHVRTIGGLDPACTFENFDLDRFDDREILPGRDMTQRKLMTIIRDRAITYADRFPELERPNWLLKGGTGLGKTFLMHCIGNRIADRGRNVVITTAYMINEAALSGWDADRFDLFIRADLLLIDDLGCEPLLNKVTSESLFNILNERMNASRPWIISTNLSDSELAARYGERLTSRILDTGRFYPLVLLGKDLRRARS